MKTICAMCGLVGFTAGVLFSVWSRGEGLVVTKNPPPHAGSYEDARLVKAVSEASAAAFVEGAKFGAQLQAASIQGAARAQQQGFAAGIQHQEALNAKTAKDAKEEAKEPAVQAK